MSQVEHGQAQGDSIVYPGLTITRLDCLILHVLIHVGASSPDHTCALVTPSRSPTSTLHPWRLNLVCSGHSKFYDYSYPGQRRVVDQLSHCAMTMNISLTLRDKVPLATLLVSASDELVWRMSAPGVHSFWHHTNTAGRAWPRS